MADKIAALYRTRLARERGAVKKDWGGRFSVALVYPNHYRTGMSSLGFQIVYQLLNQKENIVAERFFLPEDHEMSLYLERGKELQSLESLSPLRKFDVIAFSLSFENDYPNILTILEMGNIPLLSSERNGSHPLVMAGGITTFLNPEPLAPFFDLFLLGEAEALLDDFFESYSEMVIDSGDRLHLLKRLAQRVKGVYVPRFYNIVYKKDGTIESMAPTEAGMPQSIPVRCRGGADSVVATSAIISPDTTFTDRVLIELGRGCGRSCRFCAAGYVYRPPRTHEASALLSRVEEVMKDHDRVGLLSAAVSDTPGIEDLTELIVQKGGRFSVSSLRADSLSEALLENLKKVGQKSVAIAPEAGSERMRRVINKHLSHQQIVDAVRMIAKKKDFALRLYFLIGLPTEVREDVEAILDLVKSIKHHMVKESSTRGKIGQIKLSINCFIPKAFTPFQWCPMEEVSSLKEKQKWLRNALRREGGITVSFDLPKWAYVQALLSMGDRRVGQMLLLAHRFGGGWEKAHLHSEVNPDFFVHRPKGIDERLPWDFIDHGIRKEHLAGEYRLALKAEQSDICHVGECFRCGVCSSHKVSL